MSGFWSAFIIVLVIVQVVGSLWLLMVYTGAKAPSEGDTTGHTWDGDLKEWNNPVHSVELPFSRTATLCTSCGQDTSVNCTGGARHSTSALKG